MGCHAQQVFDSGIPLVIGSNSTQTRPAPWCAVAIQDGQISVARVEHVGGRPRLTLFEHTQAGAGDAVTTLVRLRKALRLGRSPISALLPSGEYSLHMVEAPTVPAPEMRAAVQWRLKDMLDYPAEDAAVDVLPLPAGASAGGRPAQLLAVASRKARVVDCIDLFDRAGLKLRAIDVPEMAQRNVAALFEEGERALALVSFTATSGLFTVSAQGALYHARTIDVGTTALASADENVRAGLIDRIVLELQRTLDLFDRQFGGLQVSRMLIVPFEHAQALRLALAESLYVPVDLANLSGAFDFGNVAALADPAAQGRHLRVLGAALRS
ncbi:MAG: agglutinin biogenesis protein MshI [Burkholderiales bacterium]